MERAAAGAAPAMVRDAAARHRAACPIRGAPPYLPRRPQASPLYRVLADHFETLERVHEERFEPTHGPLRRAAVVGRVRGGGAGGALQGCRNGRRRSPRMGGGRRDEPAVARTGEFGMERRAGTGVDSILPRLLKLAV